MMKLTAVHNSENVPAVQVFISTASGMNAGSAQITVKNDIPEANALVEGIRKAVVAW